MSVDNEPFEQGMDEAKRTSEDTTEQIADDQQKQRASFSETTETLQAEISKQVGVITGLLGALTAVVGVFTLFLNIGRQVGTMLSDTTDDVAALDSAFARFVQRNEEFASTAFIRPEGFSARQFASLIADWLAAADAADIASDKFSDVQRKFGATGFEFQAASDRVAEAVAKEQEALAQLVSLTEEARTAARVKTEEETLKAFIAAQDARMVADRQVLEAALTNVETLAAAEDKARAEKLKKDLDAQQKRIAAFTRAEERFAATVEKSLSAAVTAGLGQTEAKLNRITIAAERMAGILQRLNRKP